MPSTKSDRPTMDTYNLQIMLLTRVVKEDGNLGRALPAKVPEYEQILTSPLIVRVLLGVLLKRLFRLGNPSCP